MVKNLAVADKNFNMVQNQIMPNIAHDEKLVAAFLKVNRAIFVPTELEQVCYIDKHLKITKDRYLVSAMSFSKMLQALKIQAFEKVLEVGSLAGYNAAVISSIASEVVCLEVDSEFSSAASKILHQSGYDNVIVLNENYDYAYNEASPYDAIIISGGVESIPDAYFSQLSDGGRLIAPVLVKQDLRQPSKDCYFAEVTLFTRDRNIFAKRVLETIGIFKLSNFNNEKSNDNIFNELR